MAVLDAEGRVVEVSEALAQWLEVTAASLAGQSFWAALWRRAPEWRCELAELPAQRLVRCPLQLGRGLGGAPEHYLLEVAVNAAGSFVRLNSDLPPLAELSEYAWDEQAGREASRREMLLRVLRAEAQLDNLVHRWPGVIFTQRADLSFHFASEQLAQLTGIPLAEWQTHPNRFWQVVHEQDADEVQQQIRRSQQESRGVSGTYRIRHAGTGRVVYVLEHRKAVLAGSGLVLGYEGVWLDVTRQTIAERRLSSAAWKETLAVLTMGLAHDFSNIMAGILSLSESYLAQLEPGHAFGEGLALIKQSSLQAHQLVHRIIHLHHGKTGTREYCDLNEVIHDLVELVRKLIPRRIGIRAEPAGVPLALYADAVEFRQVIINLCLNAAEAMPQGGCLTLQTSLHEQMPAVANLRGCVPRAPVVCLAVADTGCGIKERHLGSLFDPFFTTKPMNKGSGLGLYNTQLFVAKHQGAVTVTSTEGQGATFCIWLPQANFTEAERVGASHAVKRQSLLLAGQGDGLIESTAEFLRCQGYHVVTATSKADALGQLAAGEYAFAGVVVVLEPNDAVLGALVCELRQTYAGVKIVVQLAGCHPDELDPRVLRDADELIPPDLTEGEILQRLQRALPEPAVETEEGV